MLLQLFSGQRISRPFVKAPKRVCVATVFFRAAHDTVMFLLFRFILVMSARDVLDLRFLSEVCAGVFPLWLLHGEPLQGTGSSLTMGVLNLNGQGRPG